jgi:hypothetical protein
MNGLFLHKTRPAMKTKRTAVFLAALPETYLMHQPE